MKNQGAISAHWNTFQVNSAYKTRSKFRCHVSN